MENNFVDNSQPIGYNNMQNNELYERVADKYGQAVDIVKMEEQKPVNDTKCRHPNLVPDPDDVIGNAVYHSCTNPKCGVGFYIQK